MGARAADGAVGWCAPRFAIAAIGLAAQGCLEPCWASFREYMYMWRCKREDERGVWVVSGGGTSENPRTEFSAEIARSIFHTPARTCGVASAGRPPPPRRGKSPQQAIMRVWVLLLPASCGALRLWNSGV